MDEINDILSKADNICLGIIEFKNEFDNFSRFLNNLNDECLKLRQHVNDYSKRCIARDETLPTNNIDQSTQTNSHGDNQNHQKPVADSAIGVATPTSPSTTTDLSDDMPVMDNGASTIHDLMVTSVNDSILDETFASAIDSAPVQLSTGNEKHVQMPSVASDPVDDNADNLSITNDSSIMTTSENEDLVITTNNNHIQTDQQVDNRPHADDIVLDEIHTCVPEVETSCELNAQPIGRSSTANGQSSSDSTTEPDLNELARRELLGQLSDDDDDGIQNNRDTIVTSLRPEPLDEHVTNANDPKLAMSCQVQLTRLSAIEIDRLKQAIKEHAIQVLVDNKLRPVKLESDQEIDNLCNIDSLAVRRSRRLLSKQATGKANGKQLEASVIHDDDDEFVDGCSTMTSDVTDNDDQTIIHEEIFDHDENLFAKDKLLAELSDSEASDIEMIDEQQANVGQKPKTMQNKIRGDNKSQPVDDMRDLRINLEKTPTHSDADESDDDLKPNHSRRTKRKRIVSDRSSSDDDARASVASSVEAMSDVSSKSSTRNLKPRSSNQGANKRRSRLKRIEQDDDSRSLDSETSKKPRKSRLKKNINDEDDIIFVEKDNDELNDSAKTRKKLRKILDDEKLTAETREAQEAERKRMERLKKKDTSLLQTPEKPYESLFIDIDEKTKEPLLEVDRPIARMLKPHQIDGIKFMWTSCYESVECIQNGRVGGGGCVLAHCMGLGKTLQVIAFVHTLLANQELTKVTRVMIFTPVNALLNWRSEFDKWLVDCEYVPDVYDILDVKNNRERCGILRSWHNNGGVLVIGYDIFKTLLTGKNTKNMKDDLVKYLLKPGADLVVCDEGHILKNANSVTSKQINLVETKKRIVLTGTPLQNNLVEYWCMVSFVKPSLLGTLKEFKNRFVNPIKEGQHKDSTDYDVKFMKKRAHILHTTLEGCVQRKDFDVIKPYLPQKYEYAIFVRLSGKQRDMYQCYLNDNGYTRSDVINRMTGKQLFNDVYVLRRICTHPWILRIHHVEKLQKDSKRIDDFVADTESDNDDDSFCEIIDFVDNTSDGHADSDLGSDDDNDDDEMCVATKKQKIPFDRTVKTEPDQESASSSTTVSNQPGKKQRKLRSDRKASKTSDDTASSCSDELDLTSNWWNQFVDASCEYDMDLGGKMVILGELLSKCYDCGDKLLLFSNCLLTLNFIEKYLQYWSKTSNLFSTKKTLQWLPMVDYCRIDGSTDGYQRRKHINNFNDPNNTRMRLFLISTRAGGIGINLTGANRVVIFNASWNPSDDLQSIFRVYRFGQDKPCYIYRLLSQGTMEEKIYNRQVNKQSLAMRVVDEQQLDRHFTQSELRELYNFQPDIWDESRPRDTPVLPNDLILAELLKSCEKWISRYHEHDTLLQNREDENLTEAERKAAWQEYEDEKKGRQYLTQNNSINLDQEIVSHMQVLLPPDLDIMEKCSRIVNNPNLYNQYQQLLLRKYKEQERQFLATQQIQVQKDRYSHGAGVSQLRHIVSNANMQSNPNQYRMFKPQANQNELIPRMNSDHQTWINHPKQYPSQNRPPTIMQLIPKSNQPHPSTYQPEYRP